MIRNRLAIYQALGRLCFCWVLAWVSVEEEGGAE